jgi:hypothetical protein
MHISCQSFSLPKSGRNFDDCEDACFPCSEGNAQEHAEVHEDIENFRAAVSDGATDSLFSQYWARLLAYGWGAGEWSEDLSAANLTRVQAAWKKLVSEQELPWYAEEKAELGAFAALAGLSISSDGRSFKALAIGDTCVFQTRNSQLLNAFPLTRSDEFSSFPLLLASIEERNAGVFGEKKVLTGQWQDGDVFFLMSDALACWFLRVIEEGKGDQLIDWLSGLNSYTSFAQVVELQRQQLNADGVANMRDDDVTLVRVRVKDGSSGATANRASNAAAPQEPGPAVDLQPMPSSPMQARAPRKTMEEIQRSSGYSAVPDTNANKQSISATNAAPAQSPLGPPKRPARSVPSASPAKKVPMVIGIAIGLLCIGGGTAVMLKNTSKPSMEAARPAKAPPAAETGPKEETEDASSAQSTQKGKKHKRKRSTNKQLHEKPPGVASGQKADTTAKESSAKDGSAAAPPPAPDRNGADSGPQPAPARQSHAMPIPAPDRNTQPPAAPAISNSPVKHKRRRSFPLDGNPSLNPQNSQGVDLLPQTGDAKIEHFDDQQHR